MSISILGVNELVPLVNFMYQQLSPCLPSGTTKQIIASELHNLNADSFNARYPDNQCIKLNIQSIDFSSPLFSPLTPKEAFFCARDFLIESSEHPALSSQFAYRWLQAALKAGLGCNSFKNEPANNQYIGRFIVTKSPRQIMGYAVDIRNVGQSKLLFANETLSGEEIQVLVTDIINRSFHYAWVAVERVSDEYDYSIMPTLSNKDLCAIQQRKEQQDKDRIADTNSKREWFVMERNKFNSLVNAHMPEGTKAVIVAKLHKDDSDLMSDYHGHNVTQTIVLAWSAHTRSLFPEMRKAALQHELTRSMAELPKSGEHRENYSMGAGNYLKETYYHSDGWCISKVTLPSGVKDIPVGILSPSLTGEKTEPCDQTTRIDCETIIQFNHVKKGVELVFKGKPSSIVLAALKNSVFRYHRKNKIWYAKQSDVALKEASDIQQLFLTHAVTQKAEEVNITPVSLQLLLTG